MGQSWINKGNDSYSLGKYSEAIDCYNQAIQLNPNDDATWYNKGLAYRQLNKYSEAIDCYNQAIQLNPKNDATWSNKGLAYRQLNKYSEAIDCYNQAIQLNPNDDATWYDKGFAYSQLNKYSEAIDCYNKAIQLNPKDYATWYNKGFDLDNLGKYSEAIDCYNQAIQLNPKNDVAWSKKGLAYRQLNKYSEAIDCYNKAIQLNPKDYATWYNKGFDLDNLGKYSEAIDCYNQAIQLNPKNDVAWTNKGLAYRQLNKYSEAIDCYNQAIQLNLKNYGAWSNKEFAYSQLNKYQEAIDCFKKSLQLNQNNQTAQSQIEELEIKKIKLEESKLKRKLFFTLSSDEQIKQFQDKLYLAQANNWIEKLKQLKTSNQEIDVYSQYITPIVLSTNEIQTILTQDFIAQTNFSSIYFGIFRDSLVAIKVQPLNWQTESDSQFIAILREIAILSFCQHQNIAKIIAVAFHPQYLQFKLFIRDITLTFMKLYLQENNYTFQKRKNFVANFQELQTIFMMQDFCIQISNFQILSLKAPNQTRLSYQTLEYQNYKEKINKQMFLDLVQLIVLLKQQKDNNQSQLLNLISLVRECLIVVIVYNIFSIIYELLTGRQSWANYKGKGIIALYNLIHSKNYAFFQENTSTGNQELDNLILDCVNCEQEKRPNANEVMERIKMIAL